MPATYEPIATTTLSSAQTTITFNSIPATYTDLKIVMRAKGNTGGINVSLRFNNDATATYSYVTLNGVGGSGTSAIQSGSSQVLLTAATTISTSNFGLLIVDVLDYVTTTRFKSILHTYSNDNNNTGAVSSIVGMWRSTAAIDRIDLGINNTMAIGTTATLYGIKTA